MLFLTDPIDEFAVTSLRSYHDKELTSIDSADLELPEPAETSSEPEGEHTKTKESGFPKILDLFRAALGNRVKEVRESHRLIDSPCCLVNAEGGMSTQMQRMLKMANKEFPETARILEVNSSAALIRRLCNLSANEQHEAFIKQCALQLWTNALILEGVTPDPEDLVCARAVVHGRGR